ENKRTVTFARQAFLLGALDAIEHLNFNAGFRVALPAGKIRYPPDQGDIVRAESRPGALSSRLRAQHLLRECEVTLINVRLFRESDIRRLHVSSFDQPDSGAQRKQIDKVLSCAAEIGLQAKTDIGMILQRALVNIECGINVAASFHVHPNGGGG